MTDSALVALDEGFARAAFHGPERAQAVVVVPPLGVPAGLLDPFARKLAERFRVVVVELPGSGRASAVPAAVTTRELGAALARVVGRLELGTPHLFAISLGAMIAQWTAIDAPSAIQRLVLASSAARGLDAALSEPLCKLALARHLLSHEPTRVALAEAIVSDEVREDAHEMKRIAREIEKAPREDTELAWLSLAAARHDARELLSKIRSPTLILTGENDELIPPSLQEELAHAIPGSEQRIVRGAGHDLTLDQPVETARLVAEFLSTRD